MVFEKIRKLLAQQLELDEDSITMDTDIANDLGADSLDIVEFIMDIENEFDIVIGDDDAADLRTVRQVVEKLEQITSNR